jgi:hypothetical protein
LLPSPPLMIMCWLLLPTAYDDDDEPAAVVGAAGGKVVEEFESMGMLYAVVSQNAIALPKEYPAVEFVESDAQVKIAQDTSIEYSGSWGL